MKFTSWLALGWGTVCLAMATLNGGLFLVFHGPANLLAAVVGAVGGAGLIFGVGWVRGIDRDGQSR